MNYHIELPYDDEDLGPWGFGRHLDWCVENIGPNLPPDIGRWQYYGYGRFSFVRETDRTLFAIRWG